MTLSGDCERASMLKHCSTNAQCIVPSSLEVTRKLNVLEEDLSI